MGSRDRVEMHESRQFCAEHGIWCKFEDSFGWIMYHGGNDDEVFRLPADENRTAQQVEDWKQQLRDWVAYLHEDKPEPKAPRKRKAKAKAK